MAFLKFAFDESLRFLIMSKLMVAAAASSSIKSALKTVGPIQGQRESCMAEENKTIGEREEGGGARRKLKRKKRLRMQRLV